MAHFYEIYGLEKVFGIILAIDITPELRNAPNLYEDWMIGILILIVGILAYMRVTYNKRLSRLFNSLVRIQILRQTMREELVFSHRASVLLLINFVLVSSLLIYFAASFFQWNILGYQGIQLYGVIALFVSAVYLGRLLLASFLRWMYQDSGLIREYLFESFLINKAVGVVFIPLVIGIAFVNVGKLNLLFWITATMVGLLLLFRMVQGLRMSSSYPISYIYIILYLCTLEIMPLMLLLGVFETGILTN